MVPNPLNSVPVYFNHWDRVQVAVLREYWTPLIGIASCVADYQHIVSGVAKDLKRFGVATMAAIGGAFDITQKWTHDINGRKVEEPRDVTYVKACITKFVPENYTAECHVNFAGELFVVMYEDGNFSFDPTKFVPEILT